MILLAQVKLEDVFKSTQQNLDRGVGGHQLLALFLAAIALVILLAVIQYRRRHVTAGPKTLNSPGKLLKEAVKSLPIKSAELRQLKQVAESQSCSSPLTLLICPSVLNKAIAAQHPEDRESLEAISRKVR